MIYFLSSLICIIASSIFGIMYFTTDVNRMLDMWLAIVFLILAILNIIFIFFKRMRDKNKELKNQIDIWKETSYYVGSAGETANEKLPIGMLTYDSNNIFKWGNKYAKNCFPFKLDDYELPNISPEFKENFFSDKVEFLLEISDRVYKVLHYKEIKTLYLFDVTEEEVLRKKYYNRTMTLGFIVVDNLEESLKRYDLEDKSTISGKILGAISTWLSNFDAFLQTIDDDRISFICDMHSLNLMKEDKFSILNTIREISKESRLVTTISIGVASYDISADELGKLALNAVELAEKRGGDQAVVNIEGSKIEYIGGTSSAVEKNTLKAARRQTNSLKDLVEHSSNVIIMAHNLADADAFGAMIGAYRLVESFDEKKTVAVVIEEDHLEESVKRMYHHLLTQPIEDVILFVDSKKASNMLNDESLLLVCDTQSPKLAMFPALLDEAKHVAIIDHHRVGDIEFMHVDMSYVETSASSTSELIIEMVLFSDKVNIQSFEATIMLAGIIVDTNNFTVRTGKRTFEAAANLKELGADVLTVKEFLRDSYEQEKFIAKCLLDSEVLLGRFALYVVDSKIDDRTILAKIADRLLNIDAIEASFVIGMTTEDVVSCSARSLEGINVQTIMEELGGGGHLQGAATQVKNITIEAFKENLIAILKRDYGAKGEEEMKVILIADVKGKGKKDDIINVNNGYGNYLLTNNLAVAATEQNLKQLEEDKKKAEEDALNRRNLLQKLKSEIDSKSITIYISVGADGKTHGHVTSKEICEQFELQNGIKLDKRKLEIPSEINSIGIYTAQIRLDKDIVASFEVNIVGK